MIIGKLTEQYLRLRREESISEKIGKTRMYARVCTHEGSPRNTKNYVKVTTSIAAKPVQGGKREH